MKHVFRVNLDNDRVVLVLNPSQMQAVEIGNIRARDMLGVLQLDLHERFTVAFNRPNHPIVARLKRDRRGLDRKPPACLQLAHRLLGAGIGVQQVAAGPNAGPYDNTDLGEGERPDRAVGIMHDRERGVRRNTRMERGRNQPFRRFLGNFIAELKNLRVLELPGVGIEAGHQRRSGRCGFNVLFPKHRH